MGCFIWSCWPVSSHRLPLHLPATLPTKNQATTTASSTTTPALLAIVNSPGSPSGLGCEILLLSTPHTWVKEHGEIRLISGIIVGGGEGRETAKARRRMATRKWGFLDTAEWLNRRTHNGDDSTHKTCANLSRRNPSMEEGSTKPPSGEALQTIDHH